MAKRKMTFTLPEELAAQFVREVPSRHRSGYLAEALAQKLSERERRLIRACQIANTDPEVKTIEKEFGTIAEDLSKPWTGGKARRTLVGSARSHGRRRN